MLSRYLTSPPTNKFKVSLLSIKASEKHFSSHSSLSYQIISSPKNQMGKSQHSSNSKCLCKKVFSSPCPICKLAAAPNHVSVPGKSEHKANMIPTTKVPAEPSHAKASSKVEKQKSKLVPQLTKTNRTVSLGYNDAFSNYINRARLRIQAMSNVGMEKIASRSTDDEYDARKEDNAKDAFSDYINRAKMRIRKTSSIGSRKIFSFKRE